MWANEFRKGRWRSKAEATINLQHSWSQKRTDLSVKKRNKLSVSNEKENQGSMYKDTTVVDAMHTAAESFVALLTLAVISDPLTNHTSGASNWASFSAPVPRACVCTKSIDP
jgi:hypothetical protein